MLPKIQLLPIALVVLIATLPACTQVQQDTHQLMLERLEALQMRQAALNAPRSPQAIEPLHTANLAMQKVSRASLILGTPVSNAHGESLGAIHDLVLDANTGGIAYAVVSYGGVLTIGNKLFAVPWKALRWQVETEHYVLDLALSTLNTAPGFDQQLWPDSRNEFEIQTIGLRQFYFIHP